MVCNIMDHKMNHSYINLGIVIADGRQFGAKRSREWWNNPVGAYPNELNE